MFELLLYSGIALVILGVILWIFCEYKLQNNRDKQKKLHESFMKGKTKWIHLKKYLALNIRGFVAVKVANF